jgi:hypothetical protein
MNHIPWRETCWAIAIVILLPAFYIGAYFGIVENEVDIAPADHGWSWSPRYRFASNSLQPFFGPAHEVDWWLRPEHWKKVVLAEFARYQEAHPPLVLR